MEITTSRNKINQHKGYGGFQCDCCAHGKNGLRRRRRAPREMLRALAQRKKVRYYPWQWAPPDLSFHLPGESPPRDRLFIPGLSSWKKTLKRVPLESLW